MSRIVQPFSHYEIHRCVDVKFPDSPAADYTEQVDEDRELENMKKNLVISEPFWTLYGRYKPTGENNQFGGLEAIADRDTWDDCAALLESILAHAITTDDIEPWESRHA